MVGPTFLLRVPTIRVFGGKNSREKKFASCGNALILSVIFSIVYFDQQYSGGTDDFQVESETGHNNRRDLYD